MKSLDIDKSLRVSCRSALSRILKKICLIIYPEATVATLMNHYAKVAEIAEPFVYAPVSSGGTLKQKQIIIVSLKPFSTKTVAT